MKKLTIKTSKRENTKNMNVKGRDWLTRLLEIWELINESMIVDFGE